MPCYPGDDSLAAAAAAAGPANAPAQTKVNHAAGLAGTTQNGTRNGVGNAGILIKVGGTASLAQSTDGTGKRADWKSCILENHDEALRAPTMPPAVEFINVPCHIFKELLP